MNVVLGIREKRHRLRKNEYIGNKRISYTLCIENRGNPFRNMRVVHKMINILKEVIVKHGVRNWIYVFMPDHLHVVFEGLDSDSDLWKTIKVFKQKTGLWLIKNTGHRWQKDYYDHIHRENESLYNSLWYIANNPVRKGLVADYREYFGLGSINFDIDMLLDTVDKGMNFI